MARLDEDDEPPRRRRRYDDDDFGAPPRKSSNVGLIIGIIGGVMLLFCAGGVGLVYFAMHKSRQAANRIVLQHEEFVAADELARDTEKNFREIGVATHNYHDVFGVLPHDTFRPDTRQRRPLLSWRVHLLPYVNQDALYRKFNLNEEWSSPTNIKLLSQMPAIYGSPNAQLRAGVGKTYYRGFSQRGAAFEKPTTPNAPPVRLKLANFLDGPSNTILLVDAGEAIEWTKPDDYEWSPGKPRPALGTVTPTLGFVVVLMVDGSPRRLRRTVTDQTLRHLIDRQDGMIITERWEE